VPIPKSELFIKTPLNPSTPYVRGFMVEINITTFGSLCKGKSAPDRKNIGIIRKLTISWNPCISSIKHAIADPNAVNIIAMRPIKTKVIGKR